ncbi:MAG: T9SS type A sorting domain-containing protein [Ignavibacteriales bacterium]|nr:T9SS type A sorting domain-containing protein [Ignavibacteriales bacterium]
MIITTMRTNFPEIPGLMLVKSLGHVVVLALMLTVGNLAAQTTVTSTFDTNTDGWIVEGLAGGPTYMAAGGNPGGYIYGEDAGGDDWYFKAPTKFLGNQSFSYGGSLSFDLRQYYTSSQYDIEDIIIEGGGLRLVFDTPNNPATTWTHYQVSLLETAGWKKTSLSGTAPTAAELKTVLGSITRLLIRGEYQNGTDKCDLDNVILASGSTSGSGKASLKPSVAGYVQAGKPFWVEVRVGDPVTVSGLYGLALKLQSDKATCTYVDASGAAGSFLGSSPLTFFRKVNAQTVDLGVTKTASPGVNGTGSVARAQFVSSVTGLVRFSMSDVTGVDQAGAAVLFDTASTPVTVGGAMVVPMSSGPYQIGQPFSVEVYASGMNVGTGLYGISFKLKCDKSSCTYVDGSGAAGTFLGSSPLTFFQKVNSQMVDMGVTKTSAPGATGTGPVAKAQFVSTASGLIRFTLSDVIAVDQYGARITVDTLSLSIIIGGPSVKPVGIGPYQIYKPFTVTVQASDFTSNPALYGIAFKLRSDVPSCTYVDGSAAAGSFMSTTAISYFRTIDAQTVDMGVSRTTVPGSVGAGTIASAQFVPTSGTNVQFTLFDVTAVDQNGASIPVNVEYFSVTTISAVEREGTVPTAFSLSQNYPNPFNPSTTIRFSLVQQSPVRLSVYDVLGRQVATLIDQRMDMGSYSVEWNAGNHPSGLYLYELRAGNSAQTRKMVLTK